MSLIDKWAWAVLLGIGLIGVSASAAEPYLGIAVGANKYHDSDVDYGFGFAGAAAAGYDFGGLRFEGEWDYRRSGIDNAFASDLTIKSYMLNAIFEINAGSALQPLAGQPFVRVGAGALAGALEPAVPLRDNDDWVPGYQLGVGLSNQLDEYISVNIAYRLQGAFTGFDIGGAEFSYLSSAVLVGFQMNFAAW